MFSGILSDLIKNSPIAMVLVLIAILGYLAYIDLSEDFSNLKDHISISITEIKTHIKEVDKQIRSIDDKIAEHLGFHRGEDEARSDRNYMYGDQ